MDACDPGLDISNLRTLIKQNTGTDLKLSKTQICDIYSLVQGGKLPLPPLVLSKDGSYLVDAKSPLTRKDFDTLFSSTSKVSEIRRIAKKVGVVRYADKKLTKHQLTDIIGRRLHSMNVHEPVKLRSVQTKQIKKNAFNNNSNLVNNLNVNKINNINNVNRVNNINRLNNNVNRVNNNVNRVNNNVNRVNNSVNRVNNNSVNNLSSKIKKNEKPRFLNEGDIKTSTTNVPKSNIKAFTSKKPKKPSFLNKSFIATSKIKPQNGYVFKKGNKGLGMYKNNKVVEGPVQEPPRGPIDGPNIIKQRNTEIKENELLLKSYLNRENVSKYINNSEKTNVYNRIKRGTKFNNVKTYINGIVSTKITNAQRIENQKLKLEQNRNELQKILSELTNLTNTNKSEILSKFNSNGKLNNAKTLAVQKNRNIKKAKLGNLKLNLETFLKNKNVNNKGTYINRLDAGEDISNLKREILGIVNKNNMDRKNYELKLKELHVLLNTSKNLNNSMKSKFLRNFENTRNFNKVRKNVEDEFKKIKNARNQGEILIRKADQKKLLQKILNNSENFTNDDKQVFMQRFERGDNFNTLKENATQTSLNLAKKRKNRELEEKMKAEAELKNEERRQQRKLMNEIMNNSGLLNNSEKNVFRKRFNNGDNFNKIKININTRVKKLKDESIQNEKERLIKLKANEERRMKNETIQRLRNSYNANNNIAKNIINRFEKGGMFAPKTEQNTINKITKAKKKISNKKEKNDASEEAKQQRKNNANALRENYPNNAVAKNIINSFEKGGMLAPKTKQNTINKITKAKKKISNKKEKNDASEEAKQQRKMNVNALRQKYGNNTNAKVVINKFEKGGMLAPKTVANVNSKIISIRKKQAALRKKRNVKNAKNRENFNANAALNNLQKQNNIKEKQNKFNKAAKEAEEAKAKLAEQKKKSEEAKKQAEELKRKAKELNIKVKQNKFNKAAKEAEEAKAKLAEQKKKSEEAKKRAEEAREIANRKAKEEANRKAKEIANMKAKALVKKKKEDEEKKKKEAENKKKAAQNQQLRASLTKKVKSTQMDQKVKNKLLNQLKNYSIQIRNVAPGIEKTIESEKLNGNYDEAANKKKRQEVKKQLATYISTTYPNMSKANRGKYIQRANLTQWKKGFLTGSQGMGANQAFERIKGNIRENMKAKKPPPPQKNKKANLKKLVNNTMKGRAAKNVNRLKKNIDEGISEMTVKTRIAQLNKQTRYQQK